MKNSNEKWTIWNKNGDFNFIMNTFGVTASTARLLINRGKTDEKDIREFLYPDESMLHSSRLMRNLCEAADVIEKKLSSRVKIRVIGDYDADGIMSTYILTDALKRLGAEADFYIPDRMKDGYGINTEMILAAARDGIDTIVTCDNGISAYEEAEEALRQGITLIVTDHHELPEKLPRAKVIVDPKHPDDSYPCRCICGAVVAAKLAAELLERRGLEPEGRGVLPYLEYMAIATICDVVPLTGENRTIASLGLKKLNAVYLSDSNLEEQSRNIGLKALVDVCELHGNITDYTIGFVIGPCLNATGRLDLAKTAMQLLKAESQEDALALAIECKQLNEARKDMTIKESEKATALLESSEQLDKVLVVELPDCHESIAGIIAGRLRERYSRPVFVLTRGKDGFKGSGRSIPEYNMFEEMQKCSEYFSKFGGHPMAAGLSLPEENIALFRQKINEACTLSDNDMKKKVRADAKVAPSCFNESGVKELELFYPCGQENPAPLFIDAGVKLRKFRRIGKNSNFLKLSLVDSAGKGIEGICFKDAEEIIGYMTENFGSDQVQRAFNGLDSDIRFSICYVPEINDYNGTRSIQIKIQGFWF